MAKTAGYLVTVAVPSARHHGETFMRMCRMRASEPFLGISHYPTLFQSRQAAEAAIRKSVAYAKRKKYEWVSWERTVHRVEREGGWDG